ncbi:hypothetical protein [Luteimonas sp. YGD11-2]|uniref:hypothetical protein n=1 Tax=Luteimonas sp. YGD11-2 TaxID=2508168 RepID=UPI00100ABFDF|nr:hypothetical protein [Luteimonas sp. YGD11-2]
MTSVVLLAVLLAAGWYFYRQWRYTRFEALHHPGHPQYFGAALCAVYLFALSAAIHELASKNGLYSATLEGVIALLPLEPSERQSDAQLQLHFAITLLSLLFAAFLPLLFNGPLVRTPSLAQIIATRHGAIDPLESLAIKCEEEGTLCALTLDNGKFYAGLLEAFTSPQIGKEWIAITPIASGFRDDHKALQLTTFYDIALPDDTTAEIFRVVISTKQIVTAQSFDLALYQEFKRPKIDFEGVAHARDFVSPQVNERRSDNHSTLNTARYLLYLCLPALTLAAPFAAIKSSIAGYAFILAAGASAKIAEALPLRRMSWRWNTRRYYSQP